MPKFLRDLTIFCALQALLLAALFHFYYDIRVVSPLSPATVIKHKRLAEAPSPRLILIGGSNLLFGLDSKMIEEQTPFHPVNMGLIGGLRLDYIINEIEPSLRSGDMVVMSLEYNTLNADANSDETQVIMGVASQRPANFAFVTREQWKELLDRGAMEYVGVVFRQAVANIIIPDADDEPLITQDMNAYGDLMLYHDPNIKPRKANNQNTIVKIKEEAVAANIAKMNAFVARCKQRNVQVVFAYPPIPRTHFRQNESIARRFHRQLRDELRSQVLIAPEDAVYADSNFIGLSYHLRGNAVRHRTQTLIDAINRRLQRAAERTATAPDRE